MKNVQEIIKKELEKLSINTEKVVLEHPKTIEHGDYSFFVKDKSINAQELSLDKINHEYIEKVEVVGRFINFFLSKKFFVDSIEEILRQGDDFGKNNNLSDGKIIIEYTDPNPFKEFHIGHLMSNSIGESLSRIIEWNGAEIKRANYQGDIGLHVAKTIWAMQKQHMLENDVTASVLGQMYTAGSAAYEENAESKKEIDRLNKVIFEKSDPEINRLYDQGRKISLKHFEEIYRKLGTNFDYYFFESEAAPIGMFLVEEFLKKGIFEKSEGAIVFKGEKYGLHTRVFVNSQGLPTYEAKELGVNKMKFDREDFDRSIVITANEQNEYFKVVLKAMEFVNSSVANKTRHVAHGMLRLTSGKMSSRKGNVISGESLIAVVEKLVHEKIKDRELDSLEKTNIAEQVAVGAIKYSILKQSPGKDIIFDFEKSLSFEGDSGPYLQYSHARANSVLEKAKKEGVDEKTDIESKEISEVGKLLYKFPEIVARAQSECAPQLIVTYLTELASAFNNFYANNQIVDIKDKYSPYKITLTHAFKIVMRNGLYLLGIQSPDKM